MKYIVNIELDRFTYEVEAPNAESAIEQACDLFTNNEVRDLVKCSALSAFPADMGRYQGMEAFVLWGGEPFDGERYLSFGEHDEREDEDSFGVPDDSIFYYCDEQEQERILEAIADGVDTIVLNNFSIDLSRDYRLFHAL